MTDFGAGLALIGVSITPRAGASPGDTPDTAMQGGVPPGSAQAGRATEDGEDAYTGVSLAVAFSSSKLDEKTLAGPPPAFKISLLELDRHLQESLARINAAQSFGTPQAADEADPSADADAEASAPDDAKPAASSETVSPGAETDRAVPQSNPSEAPPVTTAAPDEAPAPTPEKTAQGPVSTVSAPLVTGEVA